MMTGVVTDTIEPMLRIRVLGSGAQSADVDAVIDTGFTGYLTLPQSVIQSLGLQYRGVRKGQLADGQFVLFHLFRAIADWDGKNKAVQVIEAEGSPLVGMAMLRGFQLRIDVAPGGEITIAALP